MTENLTYHEKWETILKPILIGIWQVLVFMAKALFLFCYSSITFAIATHNFLSFRKK